MRVVPHFHSGRYTSRKRCECFMVYFNRQGVKTYTLKRKCMIFCWNKKNEFYDIRFKQRRLRSWRATINM